MFRQTSDWYYTAPRGQIQPQFPYLIDFRLRLRIAEILARCYPRQPQD